MDKKYVSRVGEKLEIALEHFTVVVEGLTCFVTRDW
jgi:predicted rRNA methylase YqxC with S4 and FtsJ domains